MADQIVLRPANRLIRAELIKAGFQQSGVGANGQTCCDCNRSIGGRRGWWMRTSYEYDEWECWCIHCAYDRLHQYDDFDEEEYMKQMEVA